MNKPTHVTFDGPLDELSKKLSDQVVYHSKLISSVLDGSPAITAAPALVWVLSAVVAQNNEGDDTAALAEFEKLVRMGRSMIPNGCKNVRERILKELRK
jgi:hypothetical protein